MLAKYLGVIFVIVIGAGLLLFFLIFIIEPWPRYSSIQCSSSDPAKIIAYSCNVKSEAFYGDRDFGTIRLQNLTGGDIKEVNCAPDERLPTGAFELNTNETLDCPASVAAGKVFEIKPDALGYYGSYSQSSITIAYTDAFDLNRTVTITCGGSITIS